MSRAPGPVAYQLAWTILFLAYFYGDHDGRVCFVIKRPENRGHVDQPSAGAVRLLIARSGRRKAKSTRTAARLLAARRSGGE